MKVYEFHFNPPSERKESLEVDLIFQSFYSQPKNIYEKKMGSLYLIGLLKNVLPKNLHFLESLAQLIKEEYYKKTIFSPEKSLRLALEKANESLEEIVKKGDVSWLGNLNFAVLSLKDFKLNFTKVGAIKIVLIRGGRIIDIEQKLKLQDIEPYPLKIFGKIVSGKLVLNDLVFIATKEVFEFLQKEGLLEEIAKSPQILDGKLEKILDEKKEELKEVKGILSAIFLVKETSVNKSEIVSSLGPKEFSLKEVLSPLFLFFQEKINRLLIKDRLKSLLSKIILTKRGILVFCFIFVLMVGAIFARVERENKIKVYKSELEKVEANLNVAKNLLLSKEVKDRERAYLLLKESLKKISSLFKTKGRVPKYFLAQLSFLNDEIIAKLYSINNFERIENPEVYFQFKREKFLPLKLIYFKGELYFITPFSKEVFKIDKEKNEVILEMNKNFHLGVALDNFVAFLNKPNQLAILRDGKFSTFFFELPYPDFDFQEVRYFKENLYFFDKKAGQVIKYPLIPSGKDFFTLGKPEFWLKKATHGESIDYDGSLWVLTKDSILKYQAGELKEKITPDIFPPVKEFSKIIVSPRLPYLFILEPIQKRILIFNKTGQLIKQFQSEKFDNLLDFTLSDDGKTIFLLNGLTVFKITTF